MLLVFAAACGGSDSGGGGTAAPGSDVPSTSAAPAMAASVSATSELPAGFEGVAIAATVDRQVVVGATPRVAQQAGGTALAASRAPGGQWQVVTIDDGAGYAPPATAGENRYGFSATAVAAGPAGFVAAGNAYFYNGNIAAGFGAAVWTSADGSAWSRVDVRAAIANLDPSGLSIDRLVATASGYVLTGSTGPRVFVLQSADGVNWTQTLDLTKAWAMLPNDLIADGDMVLLWVDEYVCLESAFATAKQPVLQLSADGGATWTELDATAIPTFANAQPEPDAAACAPLSGDLSLLSNEFTATVGAVELADGAVLIADAEYRQVALSSDGVTWTTADLPDAPASESSFSRFPRPTLAYVGSNGLRLLAGSSDLFGWLSADSGETWGPIAGAETIATEGRFVMSRSADGESVDLLVQPTDGNAFPSGPASVFTITLG